MDVTVMLDKTDMATITAAMVNGGSSDNCGSIQSAAVNPSSFNCNDVGDNPVTLLLTDNVGNIGACTATVTVKDTVPPEAMCKPIRVLLGPNGTASIAHDSMDNGSTDNCGIDTMYLSRDSFDCSDFGDFTNITFVQSNPYAPFLYFLLSPGPQQAGTFDLQNWELYIDWNDNEIFEASEKMLDYSSGVPIFQVLPLGGYPVSLHRMRILMQSDSDNDEQDVITRTIVKQ